VTDLEQLDQHNDVRQFSSAPLRVRWQIAQSHHPAIEANLRKKAWTSLQKRVRSSFGWQADHRWPCQNCAKESRTYPWLLLQIIPAYWGPVWQLCLLQTKARMTCRTTWWGIFHGALTKYGNDCQKFDTQHISANVPSRFSSKHL
jgi:hypothetical protein